MENKEHKYGHINSTVIPPELRDTTDRGALVLGAIQDVAKEAVKAERARLRAAVEGMQRGTDWPKRDSYVEAEDERIGYNEAINDVLKLLSEEAWVPKEYSFSDKYLGETPPTEPGKEYP